MRTVRRFSDAEDDVIRSRSASASGAEIAKQLSRPSASVISRQVALGLRAPNRTVRRFAEHDDEAIKASVGKESVYKLAARIGRKPSSVYGRARALGLNFDPACRQAKRRMRGNYWWVPINGRGGRVWKAEHRHLVEQAIGRDLLPTEQVHHVDLVPANNAASNLHLCSSKSEHRAIHNQLEKLLATPAVVGLLMNIGVLSFNKATGRYELVDKL